MDKIKKYIQDTHNFSVEVLNPSINNSDINFTTCHKDKISFALKAIKGIGENSISPIIENRKSRGKFKSLVDLAKRVDLGKVGKKTLETLVGVGAFSEFGLQGLLL